jgi:4'-phosphopantetheinyl transferase
LDELHWDGDPVSRRITAGEVDVWRLRLDLEDPAGALRATLAADERDRAGRMHSRLDGARYAIGRASVRAVLARYLATAAGDLHFRYEPLGRPILVPTTDLSFSLAHSGGLGVLAVAWGRAVGIDLEALAAAVEIADVADRYLPAGRVAAIRSGSLEAQAQEWVGLWTEVEACAKLDGRGLAELDASTAAALLDRDVRRILFAPARDHVAALAYDGQPALVSYFAYEPPTGTGER